MFGKFNFIFGTVNSGKSRFAKNLISRLCADPIYISSEERFDTLGLIKSKNFRSLNSIDDITKYLHSIDQTHKYVVIDSIDITVESINKIDASRMHKIKNIIDRLPQQNTYFFTKTTHQSIRDNNIVMEMGIEDQYRRNALISISHGIGRPTSDIRAFEVVRIPNPTFDTYNNINIINYNDCELYNIDNISSIIRDYKINKILC